MNDNTRHWLILRLTSLPLIPLFFYFLFQAKHLTTGNRMEFINWLHQPVTASAVLLFIVCAFYHACLGMQEIIEDYIPVPAQKTLAMRINTLFFTVLGLASVYAVLAVHFGKF